MKWVALDFEHLCLRKQQFQGIANESMSQDLLRKMLKERIAKTNLDQVKTDLRPFIKDDFE
jgi:hypothetical protein